MKTNLSEILKANKAEIERLKTANKAANRLQSKVVRYTLDDLTAIQKCTTGKWFFESLLGDHSPYSPAPFDTAEEAIRHFEEIEPFTFGTKEPEQTRAERIKLKTLQVLAEKITFEANEKSVDFFDNDDAFEFSYHSRDDDESNIFFDSNEAANIILKAIENGQSCTDKEALIKLADRFKIRHEKEIKANDMESITLDTNGLKKVVFCFKNDRFMWSTVENSTK